MSLRRAATYPYHSWVHRKLKFPRKLACLAALLFWLIPAGAQQPSEVNAPPFNAAAYRVGEKLTYTISFAQFVSAAHAEMFVAGRGNYFERDGIQLRAHIETSGVVNVALLAINNDYTTYVDATTGLPYRSQQVVREAGRTSEASSDYNQPAGTEAIPAKLRTGEFLGVFDLLSAVYRLRAMPLAEGSTYLITARNEGQEYQTEVKVTGRALIKTNVGSFNTLVARVKIKNSHDYNIRVHFSEDEWHVPVLVTAKHPEGEIRAELAASELGPAAPPTAAETARVTPIKPVPPNGSVLVKPSPAGKTISASTNSPTGPALDLPFKVGEQLNYQVYLGTAAQPVGSLSFAVTARGRYFNRDGLLFTANAQTNGAGARVFFVNDQMTSYVDPSTLLPFRTELTLAEGKWRTTRGYNVDQDRGAVVTDKRERIEVPVGTHDLISLLYAIRTFDLSPLKRNAISILAINQPRTLFVTSQRRETLELGGQKIPALLLTLTSDDGTADRLQLRLWVGDDSRHLPLRITAVTPLGPVRADLAIVPGGVR
jgi:hypothetical protein